MGMGARSVAAPPPSGLLEGDLSLKINPTQFPNEKPIHSKRAEGGKGLSPVALEETLHAHLVFFVHSFLSDLPALDIQRSSERST